MIEFEVIYADPPWRYDFSKSDSREIENQYPTMTVDEICALKNPIGEELCSLPLGHRPKTARGATGYGCVGVRVQKSRNMG